MATEEKPSPLNAPLKAIAWRKVLELGYSAAADPVPPSPKCFECGIQAPKLLRCSKCNVAAYCTKECQIKNWKQGGHKVSCDSYTRVGQDMAIASLDDQVQARNELFGRIRFYACPYAVHKSSTLGKGFLFIQSDQTLATMSLTRPVDSYGRTIEMRSLLIHFLTLGEFDQEVSRADFEMAEIRSELQKAVKSYSEEDEIAVLVRFRCGQVALGVAPLVPNYRLCKQLGREYYGNSDAGCLQLNIDDA